MSIDLNSDLGEGVGDDPARLDAALLSIVSSANVACGGHRGDVDSMTRVCDIASEKRVAIGAHVSFVDWDGFGRQELDVDNQTLTDQLSAQIYALESAAVAAGSAVTYVKPHGALYHSASLDPQRASAVVSAARAFGDDVGRTIAILGQAKSALLLAAQQAELPGFAEVFADRGYLPNGQLVPRGETGDLIEADSNEVLDRIKRMLRDGTILAVDGTILEVKARSICVHGDTPGAVIIARRLRAAIDADRVRVTPFAPPPGPPTPPRPAPPDA